MQRIKTLNLLIFLSLLIANTSASSFSSSSKLINSRASAVHISDKFTSKEKNILFNALTGLFDSSWKPLSEAEKRIWGQNMAFHPYRISWLEERIKYIIPGNLQDHFEIFLGDSEIEYPYSNKYPYTPEVEFYSQNNDTLIANLSPEFYLVGKREKHLVYLKAKASLSSETPFLMMTTPHLGVLSLQPEFLKRINPTPKDNFDHYLFKSKRQIHHLGWIKALQSLLFHEARHGDGNGHNLGFPHRLCPFKHDYAGKLACDKALNGPYGLASLYLKKSLEACKNCTEVEKEVIRIYQIDAKSRVIFNQNLLSKVHQQKISDLENKLTALTQMYFNLQDVDAQESIRSQIYEVNTQLIALTEAPQHEKELILDPTHEEIIFQLDEIDDE